VHIVDHRAVVRLDIVDDDARAADREQIRVRATESPCRAGDDCDASVEPQLVQAATGAS